MKVLSEKRMKSEEKIKWLYIKAGNGGVIKEITIKRRGEDSK